jgi:hypothetical protein
MESALAMLGLGAFAAGFITRQIVRDIKVSILEAQNRDLHAYIESQQARVDRALKGERNALTRLAIEEATKADWAKRLLELRDERDAARATSGQEAA